MGLKSLRYLLNVQMGYLVEYLRLELGRKVAERVVYINSGLHYSFSSQLVNVDVQKLLVFKLLTL